MHVRAAYALAAVFFLCALPSQAGLPPYEYLKKEIYDDEQARLYDNPLDFKAASKIAVNGPPICERDRESERNYVWVGPKVDYDQCHLDVWLRKGYVHKDTITWEKTTGIGAWREAVHLKVAFKPLP
jgi:hypothetical protein